MIHSLSARLSRYFEFEKYGASMRTEILAGASTFLSLAYIFIVNPALLAQAGIDPKAALLATAVAASLATLAMGVWAKLPFAVAPGLTMNSYFVFVVCQKMGFTWQQGLAAVFISGVLCVALTALPVRQTIIDSIPKGLKQAIAVTIGVFVASIGLFLAKIIAVTPSGLIEPARFDLAHFTSPHAIVLACGLGLSILLGWRRLNFPAGMIVAILASALLYHTLLPSQPSAIEVGSAFSSVAAFDFSILLHPYFWLPVIVFFVLDFFEGIGGFIGMTSNTSIQDKDGNVPHIQQGLWVDGLGTMGGAALGTSSLIIFVESAVGIKAGGRTGMTAVVCAILMMMVVGVGFFFAPLLTLIPAEAAAGVLVYVGYLIFSGLLESRKQATFSNFDLCVMLVMSLVCFATFSLDKSLALGLWAYFIRSIVLTPRSPAYWLGGIAAALTLAIYASA